MVAQILDAGDTHVPLLAEGYMFATHPGVYEEVDLTALHRIFRSEHSQALWCSTFIAREVALKNKPLAIDLLSSVNIPLAVQASRDYFMWLSHEETIPFDLIQDGHLARLIDGLRNVPSLDNHWIGAFLKKAIRRVPGAVIDLAKARLDASVAREDWSMQPLGHVLTEGDGLALLDDVPEGAAILRSLLDWALDRVADYQFSYRFAELVQSLCSPYDAAFVGIIEEWLVAGGTDVHFKVVTTIVRDAGPSLVADHGEFVGRALRAARSVGRNVHKELSSAMFGSAASGMRSGTPGQPFDADLELKKLAVDRLERITRTDPAYNLYEALRDHASKSIEQRLADGRRMDEEDEDV